MTFLRPRLVVLLGFYGLLAAGCVIAAVFSDMTKIGQEVGILAKPPEMTIEQLPNEMVSYRPRTRDEAWEKFRTLTPDRSNREIVDALKQVIHEPTYHWDLKTEAMHALGEWGSPEDAIVLEERLETLFVDQRQTAIHSLGELGGDEAAAILARHLRRRREDSLATTAALRKIGPPACVCLIDCLSESPPLDETTQAHVIGALGEVGDLQTIDVLTPLAEGEGIVADAAQRAIKQIEVSHAEAGAFEPA